MYQANCGMQMGPTIWDTSKQCKADLIWNPSFYRLFYYVSRHRVWQMISISFYKSGLNLSLKTLDYYCITHESIIRALFQSLIFARFGLRSYKISSNLTLYQAKLHSIQCDGADQKISGRHCMKNLRTWKFALTHRQNFGVLIWL